MLCSILNYHADKDIVRILDYSPQVLKELRKSKKLKQTELAEQLGLSQGAIAKYENDRIPNWDELKKIGQFFGVYFAADWSGAFSEQEKSPRD